MRPGYHEVHLIHIRKTGGTAVKRALADRDWFTGHEHGVRLEQVPKRALALFALRDPVERIVSGFYDRLRQGKPGYACPWMNDELAVFNRYQTINAVAQDLLSDAACGQAAKALATLQHTALRYWHWIGSPGILERMKDAILYVLWTPTLQADLDAALPLAGHSAAQLSSDPAVAHIAPSAHRAPLPPHLRQALAKHYAADYACIRQVVATIPREKLSPGLLDWHARLGSEA